MQIHASLRAEDILMLGPVHITNSMVMAWVTIAVLASFGYFAGRNPQVIPTGAQNVMEYFMSAIMSLVENTAGHYARRVFPLVATIFIFILTANYLALVPGVGSIFVPNPHHVPQVPVYGGQGALVNSANTPIGGAKVGAAPHGAEAARPEEERVPLFRAANADVNMTFGMGVVAFFFIHFSGMRVHGAWSYFKNDIANPLFLTPIKIVIEMFLPVSLSMRLFGNTFGGEMLLTVMGFPVIAVLFMFAELFFGFIQALIFSILTLIFTSLAVYVPPGHEHGDGHGEAHGAGSVEHAEHIEPVAHVEGQPVHA